MPTPPVSGTVTLPATIDFHMTHNPTRPIYVFHDEGASTITEITHLEFGRACDRVAQYLRSKGMGSAREVVAIIALSDTLLYLALVVGTMRAGLIPYLISPRNTAAATAKLLKETSCRRLLTTNVTLKSHITDIQAVLASDESNYALSVEEVPPLLEIFPKLGSEQLEDPFKPYPTRGPPALDDILLYLHSSGSTGLPKSVPHTVLAMLHWASFAPISEVRDYKIQLRTGVMALPPFHAWGLISQLILPLYGLLVVALYPPTAATPASQPTQSTPQTVADHLKRTHCNSVFIIPSFLQSWSRDKHVIGLLSSFEFVGYGGGSLPSKIGKIMVDAGVNMTPVYGATEFGSPTHLFRSKGDEDDWEYLKFSNGTKIRWVPQEDGLYECQFLSCETHEISAVNLPDTRGYSTSDLFMCHPTKKGLWKIVGRQDDVVIHASGEKTVPGPMEDILLTSPYITGAIIFGHNHSQPGVLLELEAAHTIEVQNEDEVSKIMKLLWPIVEEANKLAPAYSKLFEELVLITSGDKPLPRAGKGTVMRKATLALYSDEIENIYARLETSSGDASTCANAPVAWTPEHVETWLLAQVTDIQSGKSFTVDNDLFEQGMDSLGATILHHRIVRSLHGPETRDASRLIDPISIYGNPTIFQLSQSLVGVAAGSNDFRVMTDTDKVDAISKMIHKYTSKPANKLPTTTIDDSEDPGLAQAVILMTGTTGSLGSQLLQDLLRDRRVKTIYALNRPSKSRSIMRRHNERFMDKGFDVGLLSSAKLILLEGDTSQQNLGLQEDVYCRLRDRVNLVIHNAWRVDFNLALASFEPYIRGIRNLVDFSRSCRDAHALKFLFASSALSASSWDSSKGPYPEDVVNESKFAVGSGYGESKFVSERILSVSGLRATSFRIGQICGGPPIGAWALTDWVPILVKSSISLGALPSSHSLVSWVPMHAVSQAMIDVAFSTCCNTALNVVHPQPQAWDLIMSFINNALVQQAVIPTKLPIIDSQAWSSRLDAAAKEPAKNMHEIPALKLVDFLSIMKDDSPSAALGSEEVNGTAFSTGKMQAISVKLRDLPKVGQEDADMWVRYWRTTGGL